MRRQSDYAVLKITQNKQFSIIFTWFIWYMEWLGEWTDGSTKWHDWMNDDRFINKPTPSNHITPKLPSRQMNLEDKTIVDIRKNDW